MRALLMLAAVLLALAIAAPLRADWTASGRFVYVDREFDLNGYTGVESPLPVRLADVEVIDPNQNGKKAILASGPTDGDGFYSLAVTDDAVRDVYVRVVTRSDETADLHMDVRQNSTGKPVHYAAATTTSVGHGPSISVDFGTAEIQIGQGGEAFNIYDQMLRGMDYLAHLNGSRPVAGDSLITVWGLNNGTGGAFYSAEIITLRDTAGYDDSVILHEMGHYAVALYSASSSPSGSHSFTQCDQDIRLAFGEGFASYWGNSAIRHSGAANSHIYMRSNGAPGPGNAIRTADLETDLQYFCEGTASEVNVFITLWDIADGPSTPDATPGVDDSHDLLDLEDIELWEVMTDVIPGTPQIDLEDFWDGWFLPPVQNGFLPEMIDVTDHLSIEFYEDVDETNDTAAQAGSISPSGFPIHATFFSDPELDGAGGVDVDYYAFVTVDGRTYDVETRTLRSGADTFLELLDGDGQTVLASNSDRASGDESSGIVWTAPRADLFFVRVTQESLFATYGGYDVVVTPQGIVDDDGDGFDLSVDCDDNDPGIHPGALEVCDGRDTDCDGILPPDETDPDGDGLFDCEDNCPAVHNPSQSDFDADNEGDVCDTDDGRTTLFFLDMDRIEWDPELGFDSWNNYRGSLDVLRSSGVYTQEPGSNGLALRSCGLLDPFVDDPAIPGPGAAAFYLTTVVSGGTESGLGADSTGAARANDNPCP